MKRCDQYGKFSQVGSSDKIIKRNGGVDLNFAPQWRHLAQCGMGARQEGRNEAIIMRLVSIFMLPK